MIRRDTNIGAALRARRAPRRLQRGFLLNPFVFGAAGGGGSLTWDPANKEKGTLSNGDRTMTFNVADNAQGVFGTIGVASGKWYYETFVDLMQHSNTAFLGLADDSMLVGTVTGPLLYILDSGSGGNIAAGGTSGTLSGFPTNYLLGWAVDMDNRKVFLSVGGVYVGSADPVAGTNAQWTGFNTGYTMFPYFGANNNSSAARTVTICSGDAQCTYSPPSGYTYL